MLGVVLGFVVAAIVIGIIATALGGALGFGLFASSQKREKEALANIDQILDDTFSGDMTVSIKVGAGQLPYEDVIKGASTRGYKFLSQDNGNLVQTLVFEKA